MKKLPIYTLVLSSTFVFLSGCGTTNAIHDKLSDLSMQKKRLANGDPVSIGTNIPPTADWQCKMACPPKSYLWRDIQMQGTLFNPLGSPYTLLMDNALKFANQQALKINYINLQIPKEKTFVTGSSQVQTITSMNPNVNAFAGFYQCKRINPQHKVSMTGGSSSWGVIVDE